MDNDNIGCKAGHFMTTLSHLILISTARSWGHKGQTLRLSVYLVIF
jgi:hypothetical protein